MPELIELGVAAALIAWVATQIHLIFAVRRIKRDIDTKRQATEGFVSRELMRLETAMTKQTASLKESIPEMPREELESLRTELADFAGKVGADMAQLPSRFEFALKQAAGRVSQAMMSTVKELNDGLKTELAAVETQMPPEMAGDFRGKILKAIAREPSPKQRKELGLVGELVWNAGRAFLAEKFTSQGGTSVTYRVTSKEGTSPF